mmetsp:Transcript_43536/g.61174  ORF Transcript_43536/g.61174 Transcript_43536/m.61174 type:complete len:94 (-) Transcript_43536:12-293(-)
MSQDGEKGKEEERGEKRCLVVRKKGIVDLLGDKGFICRGRLEGEKEIEKEKEKEKRELLKAIGRLEKSRAVRTKARLVAKNRDGLDIIWHFFE